MCLRLLTIRAVEGWRGFEWNSEGRRVADRNKGDGRWVIGTRRVKTCARRYRRHCDGEDVKDGETD